MPVVNRSKSRTTGVLAGGNTLRTRKSTGVEYTYYSSGCAKRYESINDQVGGNHLSWPDKPAEKVEKTIKKAWRIRSIKSSFSAYVYAGDHKLGFPTGPGVIGDGVYFTLAEMTNAALKRVNPRRPVIELPLFLYELRELPSLIRATGNFLRRPGGSNPSDVYLASQFGWSPLLRDLHSLLNLVTEMEKKKKQLDKTVRTKRSEGTIGTFRMSWFSNQYTQSLLGAGYVDYRYKHESETRAWYVYKFKTYNPPPDSGTEGLGAFYNALTSGNAMSTLWNALPWSWLIDYLYSIGDYLEASGGMVYYTTDSLNLCQSCYVKTSIDIINTRGMDSFELDEGFATNKAWQRKVATNPVPRIVLSPFLSGRQLSILGALATSSGRYQARY